MLQKNKIYYLLRLSIDLILLSISIYITSYFFNDYTETVFNYTNVKYLNILSLLIWYLSSKIFNLYSEITFVSYSFEIVSLIKTTILHLLILVFIFFVFNNQTYAREVVILYTCLLFVLLVVSKYIYRVINARVRRIKHITKNILIIGSQISIYNLKASALSNNSLQFSLVGYVSNSINSSLPLKYLGKLNQLSEIIEHQNIDQAIVLKNDFENDFENIVDVCQVHQIEISIYNSKQLGYGTNTRSVTNFAGIPFLNLINYPLDDYENQLFKRIFDIIFSCFIILILLSWLIPILVIIIKLTSKGPAFFIQDRWGINNKKIQCFKLRTMYVDSNKNMYSPTIKNDERVTLVGKILRKYSIDELPQFINVLLGSMSIVGPRPHPIPMNLESVDKVENYLLRHLVKPGITGWAQVNGSRGEIKDQKDMQIRVNFDIWYIENWTLWLDIQIIFQTIINIIKGDEKAF